MPKQSLCDMALHVLQSANQAGTEHDKVEAASRLVRA